MQLLKNPLDIDAQHIFMVMTFSFHKKMQIAFWCTMFIKKNIETVRASVSQ